MHPNTFYARHFNQTKRDEVFVIMSFAHEFEARWTDVIEPCIREDLKLTPNRVDYNRSGESIIHDILDGIAHARIVIADITCSMMSDRNGTIWPQRNGNVMWELGIAHTMRVPDEVITVRSDTEPSIFDLTQFRAFPYDPDDICGARRFLLQLASDRLKSVSQYRSHFIRECAESLSFPDFQVLSAALQKGYIDPPEIKTFGDAVGAGSFMQSISRLLQMGALKTTFLKLTPELISSKEFHNLPLQRIMRYEPTPIASDILTHIAQQIASDNPAVAAALNSFVPIPTQN